MIPLCRVLLAAILTVVLAGPALSSEWDISTSDPSLSSQEKAIQIAKKDVPKLLETHLKKGYNIVKFKGKYYAIRHGVAVDWKDPPKASKDVLIDRSLKRLKRKIQKWLSSK